MGGHGVGGGGGFEPHGEEDDLPSGVSLGDRHRVQRRIDHPNVGAARLGGEKIPVRTGHPQHVAERAEDHALPPGDLDGLVHVFNRGDADRAAGTVHQGDVRGEQDVDAEPNDGVGLTAADLHQGPGPRDRVGYGVRQTTSSGSVAIFIAELHGSAPDGPTNSASSPISSQVGEDARGFHLVDHGDGEPHMHEHIVPDVGLGRKGEVDLLDDAAEIHPTCPGQRVVAGKIKHTAGDR